MTTHAEELDRYRRQTPRSLEMYRKAEKVLPLGVSSNFRTYEPYPIYNIQRAQGTRMWDVDGREYVDFSSCTSASGPPSRFNPPASQCRARRAGTPDAAATRLRCVIRLTPPA